MRCYKCGATLSKGKTCPQCGVDVALYKKAVTGDLSAIKELRSIVSEKKDEKPTDNRTVMIIDDIRD